MAYRRTENVARRLAARRAAILAAAAAAAAEGGMAAVQIAPVAERAGIAAGTVYRYFPSKAELVAALVAALCEREIAAIERAARAAPGPLSALAAAITPFAARALAEPRLAFALIAEPVEPDLDLARTAYRRALAAQFERLVRNAIDGGHLPEQDVALAAATLAGALGAGVVGAFAPVAPANAAAARTRVQAPAPLAPRRPGVVDARARGLVVQAALPNVGERGGQPSAS